jgi:hypothetical protein
VAPASLACHAQASSHRPPSEVPSRRSCETLSNHCHSRALFHSHPYEQKTPITFPALRDPGRSGRPPGSHRYIPRLPFQGQRAGMSLCWHHETSENEGLLVNAVGQEEAAMYNVKMLDIKCQCDAGYEWARRERQTQFGQQKRETRTFGNIQAYQSERPVSLISSAVYEQCDPPFSYQSSRSFCCSHCASLHCFSFIALYSLLHCHSFLSRLEVLVI